MVAAALVGPLIDEGERLIRALDKASIDLDAALWFYDADSEEWRLLLASPTLQQKGPQRAYATVQAALSGIPHRALALSNISVVSPDDVLIKALRMAIRTGPGITGIRFTHNTINHIFIEDAYIYRVQ
jgi:hypothetical protein